MVGKTKASTRQASTRNLHVVKKKTLMKQGNFRPTVLHVSKSYIMYTSGPVFCSLAAVISRVFNRFPNTPNSANSPTNYRLWTFAWSLAAKKLGSKLKQTLELLISTHCFHLPRNITCIQLSFLSRKSCVSVKKFISPALLTVFPVKPWNVYVLRPITDARGNRKKTRQTAALISHDLIRENELALSSTRNIQFPFVSLWKSFFFATNQH